MLLSFLCPLTDMMCRASNPLLSSIVMVFALIEWFVYIVDNSAWCEMTLIFLPRVFSPTTMLSYEISPSPDDFFGRWKRYSFIGLKTLKYFSKDETRQKGPSFAIIIPPSSAWTSCALWSVLLVHRLFSQHSVFFASWLLFRSQSIFLSWRRFCQPRRQKNNIISKKTLFCRVVGFSVLKTLHRYNFFMSSSAIGGLCSGFASPCFFSSTHYAS